MPFNVFIAKTPDNFWINAKNFYNTFPHDCSLDVKLPVCVIRTGSMLELLKELNRCPNNNVLIVSHSTIRSGLTSFFMHTNKIDQWCAISILLLYIKIYNKFNLIKTDKNILFYPFKLVDILKEIPINVDFNNEAESVNTLINGKTFSLFREYESMYTDLINDFKNTEDTFQKNKIGNEIIKRAKFHINRALRSLKKMSGINDKNFREFIKQINLLHSKKRIIEIRGCNLGNNNSILEILCYFFNAQTINAPRVRMIFGRSSINIRRNQRKLNNIMRIATRMVIGKNRRISGCSRRSCDWLGGATTTINPEGIRRQGLYYHPQNVEANEDELLFLRKGNKAFIIAEHISIVNKFAISKFGELAFGRKINTKTKSLAIQFTESKPYYFPQDNNFQTQFNYFVNPGEFSI